MMDFNCGSARESDIGKEHTLYGWCRYKRDHGGKIFIDLADRYGTTQLVFEGKLKDQAEKLGKEYVVKANGRIRKREPNTADKENPTGMVELYVDELDLINKSEVPPFELIGEKKKFLANEELRLKYRHLDLRRREMISKIVFRDRLTKTVRKFFWDNEFLELETPTIIKDTYETGAKTFLVPSRAHPGKFYSLQQSPQVYKQLCMIAGLDRYFQMAKCFRDEDLREDRQPEFTQIDVEVSFQDESYIEDIIERMFKVIFKELLGKQLKTPFHHIKHESAIANYGSDKPDLRFGNKIIDITKEIKSSDYKILKRVIENRGYVKAMAFGAGFASKKAKLDKNYMLKTIELAKALGLSGMTWLFVENNKINSDPESIAKSLEPAAESIKSKLNAKTGDIIIICSDTSERLLLDVMGKLRKTLGEKIGVFKSEFEFLWIEGFPMFERDEITNKMKPSHNPFTAPVPSMKDMLEKEPEKVLSRQYDLVLNGVELGSGSIRINDAETQAKIFKLMGMSIKELDETFGFFIEALKYGAPTEGGIALGFDRIAALLSNEVNIRELILFPKNKKFESPIDDAPSPVDPKRLKDDYGLKIDDTT